MQGNNLFEYAVIRYVPRPEREEFLNIGVILYCAPKHFLNMRFALDSDRLTGFYPGADINELKEFLHAFEEVCCGHSKTSPISRLDIAGRFRWLTATRSTIIQTSKVHPGFCEDPAEKLDQLQQQLVG
ncbi:MAG TPA: DUF3037 domain-containing protein [Chitinophagaceae bacterium]